MSVVEYNDGKFEEFECYLIIFENFDGDIKFVVVCLFYD